MSSNYEDWIKYLSPENLKGNLMGCSLYIAIYESFIDYLITQLKYFYHTGFDETGDHFDPKYNSEVLELDNNPVNASLKWFVNNGVIEELEYDRFHELRQFRNKLTHEMMEVLFEGLTNDFEKNFSDLINLRMKIDKWWIMEIEIPTNPDYDPNNEINPDDVTTGSQIMFKLITDLLSEDKKTANYYRQEFMKYKQFMK